MRWAVPAHHKHPCGRINTREDLQIGAWPANALERLVSRLAGDQRDIELTRFQERNVLGGALGVARLNQKRMVSRVHGRRKGVPIEREAPTRRCRAQEDPLRHADVRPCSRSAMMSAVSSSPIDNRTTSGPAPACTFCASDNCLCVVEAG